MPLDFDEIQDDGQNALDTNTVPDARTNTAPQARVSNERSDDSDDSEKSENNIIQLSSDDTDFDCYGTQNLQVLY